MVAAVHHRTTAQRRQQGARFGAAHSTPSAPVTSTTTTRTSVITRSATSARQWSRQLYTYPAITGQTEKSAPDLATALPTTGNGGLSADGLTYTITIRTGAKWDTTPARQITAADEIRGVKRTCNPQQPFGGIPDFADLIVGYQKFCDAFKAPYLVKNAPHPDPGVDQGVPGHAPDRRREPGCECQHGRLQADPPGGVLHRHADPAGLLAGSGRGREVPACQPAAGAAHDLRRAVQDFQVRARPQADLCAQPRVG